MDPHSQNLGYPAPAQACEQHASLAAQHMPMALGKDQTSTEQQLLEYLRASLQGEIALLEAVVEQLFSAVGSRPLNLNMESLDKDSLPLLHFVVLNEATPAPALENIITRFIQCGASLEAEDDDGDTALTTLLALAHEHQEDGDCLSEGTLEAQLGAILAFLSGTHMVVDEDAKRICCWLRYFAHSKPARQRVLDALSIHVGENKVASMWSSEELLQYLDSEAYDAKCPVASAKILDFLEKGASPRHSQNGATALAMIILNPHNSLDELLLIFGAMLEKDPGCATIKDGFGLFPFDWAADYRNVSSQHNLCSPNPASLLALLPKLVEKLPLDMDAGEICLDAQKSSRTALKGVKSCQQLRFKEGDGVLCRVRTPGGLCAWEEGVVIDLWYREDCWPEQHEGAPYEVMLDLGTRVFALVDHDKIIRSVDEKLNSSKPEGRQDSRFQRRKKDDGTWELFDLKTGRARPIDPPDSDSSQDA